jgi:Zn-finger nucleic acid-binding protein
MSGEAQDRARRAGDQAVRPEHIPPHCPSCGAALVALTDSEPEAFADEFRCPQGHGGVWLDWPREKLDDLRRRLDRAGQGPGIPLEEIMRELASDDEEP